MNPAMAVILSGGISFVTGLLMLIANQVSNRKQNRAAVAKAAADTAKSEAETELSYAAENRTLREELRGLRQVLQLIRDFIADVAVPMCTEHRPDLSQTARDALTRIDEVL